MKNEKNPAPPKILVERDRIITIIGASEMVLTKDSIILTVHQRNHPHSV